jgi:hypothetical protein
MKEKTNPPVKKNLRLPARGSLRRWKVLSLAGVLAVNVVLPIAGLFYLDWNLYECAKQS